MLMLLRSILIAIALFAISLQASEAPQTITAVVLKHFPPQYQTDETGYPDGFAIDIIEEVAAIANLKIDYIPVDSWGEIDQLFLQQGIGDIVPNAGITPERQQTSLFSSPVETIRIRAFRHAGSKLRNLNDLQKATIAVVKNNVGEKLSYNNYPDASIRVYDDKEMAFNALISGEVDTMIYPEAPILSLIQTNHIAHHIIPFGQTLREIRRAIRIQKNRPELAETLDKALHQLLRSPKYLEIYRKWHHGRSNYRDVALVQSATIGNYPPVSVIVNGEATGFAVELLRESLRAMDKQVSFDFASWETVRNRLIEGSLDVLPFKAKTDRDHHAFDLTFPYLQIPGAIVVRKNNKQIRTLSDLKKKKTLAIKDSAAQQFIQTHSLTDQLQTVQTPEEILEQISEGHYEAGVMQLFAAQQLIEQHDYNNLAVITIPEQELRLDLCFAVQKGNHELLAILNEGLAHTRIDGTYDRLHQQWFHFLYDQKVDSRLLYLIGSALLLALIALFIIWGWKRSLSQQVRIKTEKLAESEQRWKEMFYKHDGIMLLIDPSRQGKIIDVNEAAIRYYGYTLEEFQTTLSIEDINILSKEETEAEMERARQLDRNYFEFKHRLKDGTIRDVEVHSTPIHTFRSQQLLFSIIHDITDRKIAEKQLAELNQSLATRVEQEVQTRIQLEKERRHQEDLLIQQSKMAAMGEMIGAVAHQWMQPLNVISLSIDGLEPDDGEYDKERFEKAHQTIQKQISFMAQTLRDFRNFFKPNKQAVDFALIPQIQEVVTLLEAQLRKYSITVICEGDASVKAHGYPNEFKQVILNLITNAKDAFNQKRVSSRKLVFTVSEQDSAVVLKVQDNAGGIPEELLPDKLFDPYTSTKGESGTGIGLSMSKTIIEDKFNGTIRVENYEDGARFTIQLK